MSEREGHCRDASEGEGDRDEVRVTARIVVTTRVKFRARGHTLVRAPGLWLGLDAISRLGLRPSATKRQHHIRR